MSLVIDMPKALTGLKHLHNMDLDHFDQSFDFEEYKAGTKIAHPQDIQSENMSILGKGCIKVVVHTCLGEATIHILKPGDIFKLGAIAATGMFDSGNQTQMTILADSDTKIYKLKTSEIENLFRFESKLAYKLIQDMMQRWGSALKSMKTQCRELENYISKVNGRY